MRDFLLHRSAIYTTFQKLVGARQARKKFVEKIKLQPGDKVLDVGCGPAYVLEFLAEYVEYTGLDNSREYIDAAKKKYNNRGKFLCEEIGNDLLKKEIIEANSYNVVMAMGVLHHLSDKQAINLFELAKTVLIDGGKLITLDGCFMENQSHISKLLLKMDRGDFIRTETDYLKLANSHFTIVKTEISTESLNVPYTLIFMEGIKN